jgi:arginine transport system permease protein
MDFTVYLPKILSGTVVTIELMLLSLLAGLIMAIILTLGDKSEIWVFKKSIAIFVFFIRGTPMLLQFFIIYYGLGQFAWLRETALWVILKQPFACAVIALAINSSAYTMVLFKGAINSIPKGEVEACKALGMTNWSMLWHIIFPRALQLALPAYSNEVIMVLKGTSLASTITILELMGVTQQLVAQTYAVMDFYLLAGAIYLILNVCIITGFRLKARDLKFGFA